MIFLDNDDDWVLVRDRQELIEALLERIDADNDDHLRLAAACLECEQEEVMRVEK